MLLIETISGHWERDFRAWEKISRRRNTSSQQRNFHFCRKNMILIEIQVIYQNWKGTKPSVNVGTFLQTMQLTQLNSSNLLNQSWHSGGWFEKFRKLMSWKLLLPFFNACKTLRPLQSHLQNCSVSNEDWGRLLYFQFVKQIKAFQVLSYEGFILTSKIAWCKQNAFLAIFSESPQCHIFPAGDSESYRPGLSNDIWHWHANDIFCLT